MRTLVLTTPAAVALAPALVGGKALNLARLALLGHRVPPFFAVTTGFLARFLAANGAAAAVPDQDAVAQVRRCLEGAAWPADLDEELRGALGDLAARAGQSTAPGVGQELELAVRSSACQEDSLEHSFAGLYTSSLYVRGLADVKAAIQRSWRSAVGAAPLAYRRAKGLPLADLEVAVVVQVMLTPEVSGVTFTRSPSPGRARDWLMLDAVPGLGEGLVNGDLAPDHFELSRSTGELSALTSVKTDAYRHVPGVGVAKVPLAPAEASAPCLDAAAVQEIARVCLAVEASLGSPQDIEWCLVRGELHLVQARPIVGMPPNAAFEDAAAGGELTVWDNANIVESFSGLTGPLTFSHAVRAYRQVYIEFCRVMGVPQAVIAANASLYANMLGSFRGRVYYNLLNWYRLVFLFPNADRSASFMETMMGVKDALGDQADGFFRSTGGAYRPGAARQLWLGGVTLYRFAFLERIIGAFVARVDAACDAGMAADFDALPLTGQLRRYQALCAELLGNWQAPLINDCRCMLFFGLVKRLAERWLPAHRSALNDLLSGLGNLASAEPAHLLMDIARRVDDGALPGKAWLLEVADAAAMPALRAAPALAPLASAVESYLRRFGCRCADELKLEQPDLHDDPGPIFSALRTYVATRAYVRAAAPAPADEPSARARALVAQELPWLKRRLFLWTLGHAAAAIADRERLRLLRTRTFGVARRLFRAVGRRLVALGVTPDAGDVFWLTVDELSDFSEGRSATADLAAVAAARRAEYAEFARTPAPPSRFVTRGPVGLAARYPVLAVHQSPGPAVDSGSALTGTACCPGLVEGEALVATTFDEARVVRRQILVTERTDPGWVPLYPACSALLVERGSLLSHSAVVARELGLPTIIGVSGLMARVRNGQRLTVDGAAGRIELHAERTDDAAAGRTGLHAERTDGEAAGRAGRDAEPGGEAARGTGQRAEQPGGEAAGRYAERPAD